MIPGFKSKAIKPTKTVGQRLKEARRRRGLSLEQAETSTKVKLKYLRALEENRHDLLPTEVYSLGFLRCYGEVLGLPTKKLLAQYQLERREIIRARGQSVYALAPSRKINSPRLLITPKTLFTLASVTLILALVIYIASGIRSFLAPPTLTIDEPKPDSRVTNNTLLVAGSTDPTASVTINGELIRVDSLGKFRQEIAVVPGLNALEFVAVNRVGKESKQIRKVLADYSVAPTAGPTSLEPTPSPSPLGEKSETNLNDQN